MVVEKKDKIGEKLARFLEIPLDTAVDWPKIVINANREVLIQNHRGVIEYDRQLVRINTKFGEVKICGAHLVLVAALKEEITVEGRIERVEWVDWR